MAKNKNNWSDLNISDDALLIGASQAISKMDGVSQKHMKISRHEDKVDLDISIEVRYPLNIPNLSYDLQKNIKSNIEDKTPIKVDKIDIEVSNLYFEEKEN